MAKRKQQTYFRLTLELSGGIPTVPDFIAVSEWYYLVECNDSRLVFMSNKHRNMLHTAQLLMDKGVPKPISAQIEYLGPYARSY